MNTYHKIQTVWLRDPANHNKTLLADQWAKPEFEYLACQEWICTEKVDGTNVRVKWDGENVAIAGKTDNGQLHPNLVARLTERFPAETMMAVFGTDPACLYGEGYGPKIQSGGKYRDDQDIVLFDVRIGGWWMTRENLEDIGTKLDVPVVPVVLRTSLPEAIAQTMAGMKSTWGDFTMEGLVCKPAVELYNRNGDRVITKIKHKDFTK